MSDSQIPVHHETIIIGTGFSGIGLAIRLQKLGHDFMLLERSDDIGGVWRDNTYPAAACDVPSRLYSFSFAQNTAWTRSFSSQPEILAYLKFCVSEHQIEEKIALNHAVTKAVFSANSGLWQIFTDEGQHFTSRFLVSACGQLCQPSWPQINGKQGFSGVQFHSAQWNHTHDLTGKHVAVIGTGASAIQFIPEVAKHAASVTIFQRSAPYVLPKRDRRIGALESGLMSKLPALQNLIRKAIYSKNEFRAFYMGPLKAILKLYTWRWRMYLNSQIKDSKKRRLMTPDYVIGCKRILLANNYYSTLNQHHIEIEVDQISHIDANNVITDKGTKHHADTLIYATGFKASDFLDGIHIEGPSGKSLHDNWHQGAFAYQGISIHGFPNFMMCYGPNTNIGHNSMIHVLESQFNYICDYISKSKELNIKYLDLLPDVETKYRNSIQQQLSNTIWQQGGCQSWYQNDAGENTNNLPGLTLTYRVKTRSVNLNNYQII